MSRFVAALVVLVVIGFAFGYAVWNQRSGWKDRDGGRIEGQQGISTLSHGGPALPEAPVPSQSPSELRLPAEQAFQRPHGQPVSTGEEVRSATSRDLEGGAARQGSRSRNR